MIKFACIAPHPPIILPSVGSEEERKLAGATIQGLNLLGKEIFSLQPGSIIISSPHEDWGFNVPLFFLAKNIQPKIDTFLTQMDPPDDHYRVGKDLYFSELKSLKENIALIASGDLSHRLKIDGPYGLHPDGEKFDRALIEGLKIKDIGAILELDGRYPEAGECGLRSISFMLGILDAAHIKWKVNILSYEAPFGIGYLVAELNIGQKSTNKK